MSLTALAPKSQRDAALAKEFGEAIWFSRCVGKSEDGQNLYERLITFKPVSKVEVEPLPNKVTRLTGQDSD